MSLPKLNAPTYELTLPIAKKKVKFRPFTVKEQKILLLALESEEEEFTSDNIKQIIRNCNLSTEINPDHLSMIDVEYFFIHLRARSVGEEIETKYRCENILEGGEKCENLLEVNFNLLSIGLNNPDVKDIIELTPTIGVKLKYPEYSVIDKLKNTKNLPELTFDFILSCMEYIYDQDNIYKTEEYKKEELYDFLESLSLEQFKQIEDFFTRIPKLQKKIEVKCSKCEYEHKIIIEGLENFFG